MKRLILISISIMCASGAFAQSRCISTNVNLTGSQVSVQSSGDKSVTKDEIFVYYHRKHHKRRDMAFPVAGLDDRYPSRPLMLDADENVKAVPETYNVSLSSPSGNVNVCPDSTLDLNTNISVEKASSYTGNYPSGDHKVYKRVSKRSYRIALRKKRQIERKERQIARKSHTDVDVQSNRA